MRKAKTGRKRLPEAEKTVSVVFYTKRAHVEMAGGMQAAREKAKAFIESASSVAV